MAVVSTYTPTVPNKYPVELGYARGQKFTSSGTYTVTSTDLKVARTGTPGNVTVSLYSTSGGLPDSQLASTTVSADGWSTSLGVQTFTFDTPYEIAAGTYAIVLSYSAIGTGSYPNMGGTSAGLGSNALYEWDSVWAAGNYGSYCIVYADDGGGAPSKASNPTPANAATEVDFSGYGLSWTGDGDTYTVYGGAAGNWIQLIAGTAETSYTLETSEVSSFYNGVVSWRVDSTNDNGTTEGDTWTFDPRPGKASSPTPSDTGTDISIEQDFSWTIGTNGTTNDLVIAGSDILSGSAETSYALVTDLFDWEDSVEWRVDTTNEFGTTTGDTWTFTAMDLDHLRITYTLIDGGSGNGPYDGGVEGTDFWYTGINNVITVQRLVTFGLDRVYIEDLN